MADVKKPTETKGQRRVARYIRVSTLEQAKEGSSLDGQQDSLNEFIKSNLRDRNWVTTDDLLYIDDGYSGADDERPAFQRMMNDARADKFDVLLVWKIDRLFRKTILLLETIEELRKLGIEFVSKNESIDTSTSMGRFSLTVLGAVAEMERENIRERTIMGKITNAKKGYYVGGKYPPFGYDVNKNGKMIINKDEAKVVKQIFQWFVVEKKSQTLIAKLLTADSVPTKADRMGVKRRTNEEGFWAQAAVAALLMKDEYTGTYYYGKRETYLNDDEQRRQRERPREEWIALACPKIIEKEIFEKARQLAKDNPTYSARASDHVYLLRSKVFCGKCGGRYRGYPKKKKGIQYFNYHCSRKSPDKSDKPCKNKEISELKLDAIVWKPIDELLKNPKAALKAFDEKMKKSSKASDYREQISKLEDSLKKKDIELERLASAMRRGKMKERVYDKQVDATNAETKAIQEEIERLQRLLQTEIDREELKKSLAKLSEVYRKKYGKIDRKTQEAIIRKLVNKVVINPNGTILVDYAIEKNSKRVFKHGGDAGS